jgi:hypothetical protein
LAQCVGAAVIGLCNCDRGRRRQDCHSAKQRYGNRGGADTGCDFRFHSVSGKVLVYLFLRKILACVAKKVVKSLATTAD